jgi:hypothetical protein
MKAKAVSALRSKRGLRRMSGAEPQVVGLTPLKGRANTMKTYLLRNPKTVEPQSGNREPKAKGKETTSGKLRRACPVSVSFYGAGSTTDGKDVRRNHTLRPATLVPRLSPFRSFGG